MLLMSNPARQLDHPGDSKMSDQSRQVAHLVSPTQVWAALASDLKAHAVWLLAQLAFNLVIAQAVRPTKEAPDVTAASQQPQNPA
jgi:hypothetical protein